jgi:hypothetical protein
MDVGLGLRQGNDEAHEGIRCDEQRAASRGNPLEVMNPRRAAAPGSRRKLVLAGVESSRRAKPRRRRSGSEGSARFASLDL